MMSQQQRSGGINSRAFSEAFTASETVNLMEKMYEGHTKGTTGNTMMQKSLLWAPH